MSENEMIIMKEVAKNTAEFGKEIALVLAKPSAKIIGDNLGLMVDGVFGWLGCWGEVQKIKQHEYIEDFKSKTSLKILSIPEENLIEPKMNIVGPIIEKVKYSYEESYFREMFSNLLAAACDKTRISDVHPAFVEVINQLSPIDAKFINLFKSRHVYPMCDVQGINKDKSISPFNQSLFDFGENKKEFSIEESIHLTTSLNNLIRLGLVLKNREIIVLDYNYSKFEEDVMYKTYDKIKKNSESKLKIIPSRLELTEMGKQFARCCILEKTK